MQGRVIFLLVVLFLLINNVNSQGKSRPKFESLSGVIDDCCCEVQTVDHSLYNERMHTVLKDLIESTYFRYFKVNYLKDCPFWVEHALCSADGPGECGICECDENEIPQAWNDVKPTNKESILSWKEKDEDVWIIQDDTEDTMYVNLQTNPERFTGYGGNNSNNIWLMIYKENCFPDPYECTEQRIDLWTACINYCTYILFMNTAGSISFDFQYICENFHHPDGSWGPHLDMFVWRLGAFPDRLKNIYFTFVYLLRAANKASEFLSKYDYYTAHEVEDHRVQSLMRELLSSSLMCSNTFDETSLFQGERAVLKKEFMAKFRNISEIMDCVTCQTCKVHAKLQILGIATATKILIADDPNAILGLQHNEISALINTLFKERKRKDPLFTHTQAPYNYIRPFIESKSRSNYLHHQFSESIEIIHNMKAREDKNLLEQQEKQQTKQQDEQQASTQQQTGHGRHTSLYALISVVVLITVATLYSRNNILKKHSPSTTNNTAKKGKGNGKHTENDDGAEENTNSKEGKKENGLRKSNDKVKVKNNHNTTSSK